MGLGALSQTGATRLASHTEGNALYCRALLDEIGVAELGAAGDGGLPAPRQLSAVILARVAVLPAETQGLLAAASVLGTARADVDDRVACPADRCPGELDAAVTAGPTERTRRPGELTFTHPLYRAAVYADLSPTRRRELHARAAELVAGHARLVHRVAAARGPEEALARELEASAVASAAAGDVGASAWTLEQAASLSPGPDDRERRLLDAARVHLDAADSSGAARAPGVLPGPECPPGRVDRTPGGVHGVAQRRGPPARRVAGARREIGTGDRRAGGHVARQLDGHFGPP